MLLQIQKYPAAVLKKKSEPVKEIDQNIKTLIKDMIETMYESEGLGLAAPQTGVSKRIFVVNLKEVLKDNSKPAAFINPVFIGRKGKTLEEEGCLSVPNLYLNIKRAKEITVKAQDENGKSREFRATGLLARVFQHEMDHLDGILIIDRLPMLKKWRVKRKLKQENSHVL